MTSDYDSMPAIDAKERPLAVQPVVYKFEDMDLLLPNNTNNNCMSRSMTDTSEIFEQILKQVERATSQAEQLEHLDDVEVSYAIFDGNRGIGVGRNEDDDVVSGVRTPTNDKFEFIPFYQVSEELIIEESYNFKKDTRG